MWAFSFQIGHSGHAKQCNVADKNDIKLLINFINESPSKESLLHVLDFTDGFPKDSGQVFLLHLLIGLNPFNI